MSSPLQVQPVFPVWILHPMSSLQLLPAAPCCHLLTLAGFKSGRGASNTWAWICQNTQVLWLKQEGIHVIDRVANLLGITALLSWSHVVISKHCVLSQYLKSIIYILCECLALNECVSVTICVWQVKLSHLLSLELLQISLRAVSDSELS